MFLDKSFIQKTLLIIALIPSLFILFLEPKTDQINTQNIKYKAAITESVILETDRKTATKLGENNDNYEDKSLKPSIIDGSAYPLQAEYQVFRQYVDSEVAKVDVATISIHECNVLQHRIRESYKSTDMYRARGRHMCSNCDEYLQYAKLSTEQLEDLAQNEDFEAMHVLGKRYLYDLDTIDRGIVWLEEAIARGSISAIASLEAELFNMANNNKELEATKRQEYWKMHDTFDFFYDYRSGRDIGLNDLPNPEEHPVASVFLSKLRQLEARREELGLQEFFNVDPLHIPDDIFYKCADLENELIKQEARNDGFGEFIDQQRPIAGYFVCHDGCK